jgi:hypothetical protein
LKGACLGSGLDGFGQLFEGNPRYPCYRSHVLCTNGEMRTGPGNQISNVSKVKGKTVRKTSEEKQAEYRQFRRDNEGHLFHE